MDLENFDIEAYWESQSYKKTGYIEDPFALIEGIEGAPTSVDDRRCKPDRSWTLVPEDTPSYMLKRALEEKGGFHPSPTIDERKEMATVEALPESGAMIRVSDDWGTYARKSRGASRESARGSSRGSASSSLKSEMRGTSRHG